MTPQATSADYPPVCAAALLDSSDTLLLNPDLSAAQWRRERLRAALRPRTVLKGLVAVSLAALGFWTATGTAAVLMIVLGILAVIASVLVGWADAIDIATWHGRGQSRARRAKLFLRINDFEDDSRDTVRALIDCVDRLHRSPARDWIDPALLRGAHRVAWQTLRCLDQTREARTLAAQLASDPAPDVEPLSTAAHRALAATDETVAVVVRHLQDCVALADAWAAKLRYTALAARTDAVLADLARHTNIQRIATAAETLPQHLFACVTAARDVTNAGPFPWERQRAVPIAFHDA